MSRYFDQVVSRHQYITKFSSAFIYAVMVAVAMNFFWIPGHVYSSGLNGLAQLINTLTMRYGTFTISIAIGLFALNIPLFILAWFKIGHEFTIFTIISVLMASILIKQVKVVSVINDPLICAVFGGAINGYGTGFALKNGISTGGLDVLGLVIKRKTGRSMGNINIIFNSFIIAAAGVMYGWPYAFYSALGLVVNAKVIDLTYTREQLQQVTIITREPNLISTRIQNTLHRGVTIIPNAEGGYYDRREAVLITVITRYELKKLKYIVKESSPQAFFMVSDVSHVYGNFKEYLF